MENDSQTTATTKSPRTSPTKVISEAENENNKKLHELKIFKTSKPIKDNTDERALTSKKSSKKSKPEKDPSSPTKHGFFHKMGFKTSKSASVSPVKNILSSIPRRSSEINDESAKAAAGKTSEKNIQRKNVEEKNSSKKKAILEKQKSLSPSKLILAVKSSDDKKEDKKIDEKVEATDNNNELDDDVDENDIDCSRNPTPISSYEDPPPPPEATAGTESDARVSQTIIMKKRTLHEAKTEASFISLGNIISELQSQSAHASASLDISHPKKQAITVSTEDNIIDKSPSQKSPNTNNSNNNIFTSCKPSIKQTISDSFSPSKKSLTSINSSKVSSNATLSTAISIPSSTTSSKQQQNQGKGFQPKSELDLSGPLSRLGLAAMTSAEKQQPEGSLAEKLSRSFFDLTQGSQDRLQKWKNKLQTGKKHHPKISSKDSSEPPTFPGFSDMNSLLDWTATDKPKFVNSNNAITTTAGAAIATKRVNSLGPRPLHPSRSATNAAGGGLFDHQDVYLSEGSTGMIKSRGSFREANKMEHRTLKPRENIMMVGEKHNHLPISVSTSSINSSSNSNNNNNNIHYQNMKNLQQLVQTIEGYSASASHLRELDLPPPARILPYSGIKPQDNGIIRPIAFRPLNQSNSSKESSSVSELIATKNRENSRSIGNLAISSNSSSIGSVATRNSGIPSTSSATNLFPLISSISSSKITDENDYDTVPEFIPNGNERKLEHHHSLEHPADNYSLIYNFHQQPSATAIPSNNNSNNHRRAQSGASSAGSGGGGNNGFHYHLTGQSLTSSNSSSTTSGLPNSPPHTASSSGGSSSVKKSASRHSGLHITPSPSDSGIVDYETLIRDKENELSSVRNAMEQNEEVLVRVYQEKERQFREQMTDLRQKLQASQQGEAALRQQLRQSDEKRQELQRGFQNLSEEKQNLQMKCQQIERELYTIRNRFEDFVRDTKAAAASQSTNGCEMCRRKPQIIYENGSISSVGSSTSANGKAPIPAPRLNKENNDRQLRGEVDDLRGEISSLRDQLNTQMQMFAEERRRWENERKNRTPSPKTQFRNASQDKRTAVLLSNDRLI